METKSYAFTIKAPVEFKCNYIVDVEEIEAGWGSLENYILHMMSNKDNIADMIYQDVKEDLFWAIKNNVSLCEIKPRSQKANEFAF